MILPSDGPPRNFLEGVFLALSYWLFFWRIFKQNPGNRLIECGCMTVIVFIALIPMTSTTNLPDWLLFAWLLLTTLLCFATLFFFGQRILRALAHKNNGAPAGATNKPLANQHYPDKHTDEQTPNSLRQGREAATSRSKTIP